MSKISDTSMLKESGDLQLIHNFIARYPSCVEGDQNLLNLNAVLGKKGYNFSSNELMNIIREIKFQGEIEKIKKNVLSTNPKSSDEFIKNYIKLFRNSDIPVNAFNLFNRNPNQAFNAPIFLRIYCITVLLKELFDYRGNLGEDFIRLKKDIELEKFEKKLIGDPSLRITINDVDQISGYDFERVLKALFEKMEYHVEHTSLSNDQGADLIIEKTGLRTVVQAKNWQNDVTNKAVQEAVAAINHYNANRAMVISGSGFTQSARELARSNNVVLWDRTILTQMLDENPIFRD